MKKFLLYFFAFIFICFLLPAILTKTEITVNSETSENEETSLEKNEDINEETSKKYDYKKYGTINLLHKETGEVENVELDTYLYNVVF